MINKRKTKDLGSITNFKINVFSPFKLETEGELDKIALIIGKNGSGKSFLLKLNWAIQAFVTIKVKERSIDDLSIINYVFNHTFTDNELDGQIECSFSSGSTIYIQSENGKITYVTLNIDDSIVVSAFPIFMSTTTRTFDEIERYYITEKSLSNDEEILKYYRLYDVVFCNNTREKYISRINVDANLEENLEKFNLKEKLDAKVFYFEDGIFYYETNSGKKKRMTSLSKGEQSLLNMILASR